MPVDVAKRRRNELKFFLVVVLYICMSNLNVQGGGRIKSTPYPVLYKSLSSNFTNKSHDGGKEGHCCHCNGISNNLPLTRGVPLVGQLSL